MWKKSGGEIRTCFIEQIWKWGLTKTSAEYKRKGSRKSEIIFSFGRIYWIVNETLKYMHAYGSGQLLLFFFLYQALCKESWERRKIRKNRKKMKICLQIKFNAPSLLGFFFDWKRKWSIASIKYFTKQFSFFYFSTLFYYTVKTISTWPFHSVVDLAKKQIHW